MEYKFLWPAFISIVVGFLWCCDFWKIFKKPQLANPTGNYRKYAILTRLIVFTVGIIAWGFISYAMTGPRKPLGFVPSDIEVNDIFMVVDVSRSMLAEDLEPNRLEVAKKKLREFAALRPTDRIGIIIFSEKVFTLLPLTTDPTLVDKVLSEIKIGYLGSGTNIGDALALAVARGQGSETKNKVIILLTDGVNNIGNMTPINAAEVAKKYNMKVYTIGLGSKNSKLPIGRDAFGNMRYQNMPGGSIDLDTLDKISAMTGGKSYLANSKNSLKNILEEIQQLEKTKIKSQGQVIYDELFHWYLLVGFIFLLISELAKRYIIREVA